MLCMMRCQNGAPWNELLLCGFSIGNHADEVLGFAELEPSFSEALENCDYAWGENFLSCVCREGGIWFSLYVFYFPNGRRYRMVTVEMGHTVRKHCTPHTLKGMLYSLEHCAFRERRTGLRYKPDGIMIRTDQASVVDLLAAMKWTHRAIDREHYMVKYITSPLASNPQYPQTEAPR